jgi:predicted acetyltransferase
VRACAVSNVTVLPTHRRRGLLRQIMRDDLAGAVDRGEPVAVLVASEWPIYGRFGFGPATDAAGFELRPREARFLREGGGEAALVTPEEWVAAAPGVFDAHRRSSPGEIGREGWRWDVPAGLGEGWQAPPPGVRLALVRDGGRAVTGLARWHVEDHWVGHQPHSTLVVDDLLGADAGAVARLWRLVGEVDLVETVRAGGRSVDDPLRWLVDDGRGVRQTWRSDWLWARLLDVPAALGARAWSAAGPVVIEVEDELGHAAGRYALEDGVCGPATSPPDLTVPVATLSACYLGGRSLRTLAAAGWATEHRAGAIGELDRLLRSDVAPWCATMF